MKSYFALLIMAVSILVIQTSCKKAKSIDTPKLQQPPVSLSNMLQCHGETFWDSISVHNALIGQWQWKFIKCYWNPETANGEDYKTLTIEIKENDSLEVKINNQITQSSSWNVTNLNNGYYTITVNPIVPQLQGKVLFCGDSLLFYDSYVDGCDNYFEKQN